MTPITPTGDALLDATLGLTDTEWLKEGLGGLSSVPSSELAHIFNIGAGDGLWSKVASAYAADACVVSIDWRTSAGFEKAVPNVVTPVWVPFRHLRARDGSLVVDLSPVRGFTLGGLLREYNAEPSKTAVRYQGLSDITALADGLEDLRMFTGILYGASNNICKAIDLLQSRFKEFNSNQKGEVYYVRGYNSIPSEDAVSRSGVAGASGGDATGDWTVGDQPG